VSFVNIDATNEFSALMNPPVCMKGEFPKKGLPSQNFASKV